MPQLDLVQITETHYGLRKKGWFATRYWDFEHDQWSRSRSPGDNWFLECSGRPYSEAKAKFDAFSVPKKPFLIVIETSKFTEMPPKWKEFGNKPKN